jgi:hypothetical protein
VHRTALRHCVQRRLSQLVVAATGVTDVPFGALSASAFIELDGRLGEHIRSAPFQEKVRRRGVVPLLVARWLTRLTVAAVAGTQAGRPIGILLAPLQQ